MSEWQDIASAPKDESNVLIAVGELVGEAWQRCAGDSDDGWWWANTGPGDYSAERVEILHGMPEWWQPLPEPPICKRAQPKRRKASAPARKGE